MTPPDPTALSAVALAAALRAGELTAVDALDAFRRRIARLDPHLHAVVRLNPAAHDEARAADAARAAGKPLGPLHGVPMTVKDGMRVGGVRTGYGVPGAWLVTKPGDCELVRRVRAAGAVVVGRTAVPLAMFDWQCRTPLGRECVNPLDRRRTPGGSSGGAAAALAARLTPLEVGSDLAGSIRYPTHCCGLVSLRASTGLLPTTDTVPDGRTPTAPSAVAFGPMARALPDLRLLADVLLADDDRGKAPPPPAGDRLRVAVLPALPELPVDRATGAAFARLVEQLRAAGHAVTVLDRPPFDFADAYALYGLLVGYEMRQATPAPLRQVGLFARAAGHFMLRHRLGRGPLADHACRGVAASAGEYRDGLARQAALRERLAEFFTRFDLWVLPVSPSPAVVRQPPGRPINGHPYTAYLGTYLCPPTIVGTPVVTLPIGRDGDGLPIGAQVHGPRFGDRWLVRAAVGHLGPVAAWPG